MITIVVQIQEKDGKVLVEMQGRSHEKTRPEEVIGVRIKEAIDSVVKPVCAAATEILYDDGAAAPPLRFNPS
jgi:hypothetical protein